MFDDIIRNARKRLNFDTESAEIGRGDGQGDPRDRTVKGNLYVRRILPDGGRSGPISLPVNPNANLDVREGFPVRLGYDSNGKYCILEADVITYRSTGGNALLLNPLDQAAHKTIDARLLSPLYWERHPDTVNEPLTVVVLPGLIVRDTTIYDLTAYIIRLDDPAGDGSVPSLIPGAGEYAWVVVLWTTNNTLEAFSSTPKTEIKDMGMDDLMEALNQRSAGSIPICGWLVGDDQTVLTGDPTRQLEMRQIINVIDAAGAALTVEQDGGTPSVASVDKIVFDGATVTDDTGGQVTVTITGAGAPTDAKYVVAEAASGLSDEVNLGALTSGLLKHTVSSGLSAPAVAVAGTDYTTPTGTENLTNKSIIALAWELLLGGFKAIFTHSNSADRTYTLPNKNGTFAMTSDLGVDVLADSGPLLDNTTNLGFLGQDGIVTETSGATSVIIKTDGTFAYLDDTQIFTNKTIDGDDNTVQDLALSSLKTVGANTNRVLTRDGSGAVVDTLTAPTSNFVGEDDTQTLSNKVLDEPTIADFTNAQHDHNGAIEGGYLSSTAFAAPLTLEVGGTESDLSAAGPGHLVQASAGAAVTTRKDNFSATRPPLRTDDTAAGWELGSFWFDTTNNRVYVCLDNSSGAAKWKPVSTNNLERYSRVNGFTYRAAGATNPAAVGAQAATVSNTGAVANEATNAFISLTIANLAGGLTIVRTPTFDYTQLGYDPTFVAIIKTPVQMTTSRIWIGIGTGAPTNSGTATGSAVAFRYSVADSDPGWMAVTRDGSSQSVSVSQVAAVATDTIYKLKIRFSGGGANAYFSVNDGAETLMTATLPATSTDLGAYAYFTQTSTSGATTAKFGLMEIYWEYAA